MCRVAHTGIFSLIIEAVALELDATRLVSAATMVEAGFVIESRFGSVLTHTDITAVAY
jgi:hypothetical protein